jgi:hypothetical protein
MPNADRFAASQAALESLLLTDAARYGGLSLFLATFPGASFQPTDLRCLWDGRGQCFTVIGHVNDRAIVLAWPSPNEDDAERAFRDFAQQAGVLLIAAGKLQASSTVTPAEAWCAAVILLQQEDAIGFGSDGQALPAYPASLIAWRKLWGAEPKAAQKETGRSKRGRPAQIDTDLETLKLAESGDFASDQALADHLDVTPSTVSKRLDRARKHREKTRGE